MRNFVTQNHIVNALGPTDTPAGEDYVSLKGWDHLTVIIQRDTGSSAGASAVTMKQATAVAGTGEKALGFSTMWANEDSAASDTLVETAVTSNTFNMAADNDDKLEVFVIEIETADLDQDNDFDCARVDMVDGANAVYSAVYILSRARYSTGGTPSMSAIID